MRSKRNLKNFSHVTKTAQEKSIYADLIGGTTKSSDEGADSFDSTLTDEKPAGNPEPIKKDQNPYKSWRTWFKEHYKELIVIVIGAPLFVWAVTTFISYGNNIATLNANYSGIKDDVNTLKTKYDGLNNQSIKAGVLLDQIQKDLDSLNQRINVGATH